MKKFCMVCLVFLSATAFGMTDDSYLDLPGSTRSKIDQGQDYSIFDDVRLHGGVAYLNSFQDYLIAPGVRERGGIRGFELNFGIDLFSEHWIAQGVLMSYPESAIGDTRLSSNGFELRILYETAVMEAVTAHFGAGIASRAYTVKTKQRPGTTVVTQDRSFSSGASSMVAGVDYWPSGQVSAGLELVNHLPMATGDDPTSIDLGIRVSGHF